MVAVPPPGFLEELKELYELSFVPQPFKKKTDFEWALAVLGSTPGPWSDEVWEEYVHFDSILAHDEHGQVYRFIRTITILVARIRNEKGSSVEERLYEVVEYPDGTSSRRTHNTSISEKLRWREKSGRWTIKLTQGRKLVRRAAWEELRIRLRTHHLIAPLLVWILPTVWYRKDEEIGPIVPKLNDPKRPGIITYNYLYHAFLRLVRDFWRDEYRERKYRNGKLVKTMVHRWTILHRNA